MDSNSTPMALSIFLEKAGIDPDAAISMNEFDQAALRLAKSQDFFDLQPPFLFFTVEQHRDTIIEDLRSAKIPEPVIKNVVGKMSLHVPSMLKRTFTFWSFPDRSGIMRFESANWSNMSPILSRLYGEIAAEANDAQFAAQIMSELSPAVDAAKRAPRLFPMEASALTHTLRVLCMAGPIAIDEHEWRKGFTVRRFPDAPLTPSQFWQICLNAGHDLAITEEERLQYAQTKASLSEN